MEKRYYVRFKVNGEWRDRVMLGRLGQTPGGILLAFLFKGYKHDTSYGCITTCRGWYSLMEQYECEIINCLNQSLSVKEFQELVNDRNEHGNPLWSLGKEPSEEWEAWIDNGQYYFTTKEI